MATARAAVCVMLVLVSGCLGVGASFDESTQNGAGSLSADGVNTTEIEQAIHERVNAIRADHGVSPLAHNPELQSLSQYYANRMAEEQFTSHIAPDGQTLANRYSKFNIDCRATNGTVTYGAGENLAQTWAYQEVSIRGTTMQFDGNESRIAQGLVMQWINSEEHRNNLLWSGWNSEAIGVQTATVGGEVRVYAAQHFC